MNLTGDNQILFVFIYLCVSKRGVWRAAGSSMPFTFFHLTRPIHLNTIIAQFNEIKWNQELLL